MSEDVKNLYHEFGSSSESYHEINRLNESHAAMARWPLLRDVCIDAGFVSGFSIPVTPASIFTAEPEPIRIVPVAPAHMGSGSGASPSGASGINLFGSDPEPVSAVAMPVPLVVPAVSKEAIAPESLPESAANSFPTTKVNLFKP